MVKVLTGVFHPTSGDMYVAGRKVDFRTYNVRRAHEYGIETVYQDKSLGEKQVLWRNFFIGRQITRRFGFIDVKKEKEIANEIMLNTIGFRGRGSTVDSKVSKLRALGWSFPAIAKQLNISLGAAWNLAKHKSWKLGGKM